MTVSAKDLGHLHNLHIEFQEVVGQLDRGPKRIKAKQQQTAQKMQELDEARAALKQTKVSAEQKNLELKSLETRISSMNGKLNQATSNKEFEAIKGQIMADEMAKSVLEDEGLEILDRVDVAYAKMKECEEALKKAQEEEKQFRDQFDSRAAELNASAKRLESEIATSSKVIPAEFQEQFRRVSANKGADCMAPLINGTCQGCYFNLPAQTVITIKTGHIVFCKSCAALLYPSE